jgi:hypothetical protein
MRVPAWITWQAIPHPFSARGHSKRTCESADVGEMAPPAEAGGFLGPWTTACVASVKARLLERRRAPCAVRAGRAPEGGHFAVVRACGQRLRKEDRDGSLLRAGIELDTASKHRSRRPLSPSDAVTRTHSDGGLLPLSCGKRPLDDACCSGVCEDSCQACLMGGSQTRRNSVDDKNMECWEWASVWCLCAWREALGPEGASSRSTNG